MSNNNESSDDLECPECGQQLEKDPEGEENDYECPNCESSWTIEYETNEEELEEIIIQDTYDSQKSSKSKKNKIKTQDKRTREYKKLRKDIDGVLFKESLEESGKILDKLKRKIRSKNTWYFDNIEYLTKKDIPFDVASRFLQFIDGVFPIRNKHKLNKDPNPQEE